MALAASTGMASAQGDFPNKPIRIIVGLAAGAINDVQARVVAAKLAERVKQPVVVENRTGAGGNIAAEFVARAAPDGYTLLMTPTATMVINPAVYTKLPYKSPDDFVPIMQLSTYPLFLAVQNDLPVKSVKELLAYAKANPAKANLASPATFFDMVTALLTLDTGVKFEVIRFKSTPETMTALITGQAMISFQEYRSIAPQLKAGKAKTLATLSTTRSADLPDVPTIVEQGYPHAAAQPFSGIVAPAKTPPAVVKKLETEIKAVLNEPDVKERWKSLGLHSVESSSEAFGKLIVSEIKRWKEVATKANIKLD
jgi:tripartite-type tricarboxylate transporter receptor subunit TctC